MVAAQPDSIVMLEGGVQIVDEEAMLEALFTAHEVMQPDLRAARAAAHAWRESPSANLSRKMLDPKVLEAVRQRMAPELEAALAIAGKKERGTAVYALSDKTVAELAARFPDHEKDLNEACEKVIRERVRRVIIEAGQANRRPQVDRHPADQRKRSKMLPRTHGSALFTRGETQALATGHARHFAGRAED